MFHRTALAIVLAALMLLPLATVAPFATPAPVPAVAGGYTLAPLVPMSVPTAITFGPGGTDGPDLYATIASGQVLRVALEWTDAGPVAADVSVYATGFSLPLGLEFDDEGALYVTDSAAGSESGRTDGRLTRIAANGDRIVVVDGLPNGNHNANNLGWGPDGRLYITNGNPNDSGPHSGRADVFPYSGAILSVDVAEVTASPAVLRWADDNGVRIHVDDIASHPLNDDFAQKVHVLAWGFRNVYDVAFSPAGNAYTATNGADYPASQDLLYKIQPGVDHGFPFCYNEGPPGGTDVRVVPNPLYGDASRCDDVPPATALLGWHVCATGLDFPNAPGWGDAVYVAECGPLWADSLAERTLDDPLSTSHNTGHKVVRVALDENGDATEVRDFVTGLVLPTDVHFGPDGAMYIADAEIIYRVNVAPILDAPPVHVIAGPAAAFTGFATPAVAVQAGGALTFKNLDLFHHDVVASGAYGPDDQPWCHAYTTGMCPLFWSNVVALGETPVLGTENLEAGETYAFHCTLHPTSMRGTLVALPSS